MNLKKDSIHVPVSIAIPGTLMWSLLCIVKKKCPPGMFFLLKRQDWARMNYCFRISTFIATKSYIFLVSQRGIDGYFCLTLEDFSHCQSV